MPRAGYPNEVGITVFLENKISLRFLQLHAGRREEEEERSAADSCRVPCEDSVDIPDGL